MQPAGFRPAVGQSGRLPRCSATRTASSPTYATGRRMNAPQGTTGAQRPGSGPGTGEPAGAGAGRSQLHRNEVKISRRNPTDRRPCLGLGGLGGNNAAGDGSGAEEARNETVFGMCLRHRVARQGSHGVQKLIDGRHVRDARCTSHESLRESRAAMEVHQLHGGPGDTQAATVGTGDLHAASSVTVSGTTRRFMITQKLPEGVVAMPGFPQRQGRNLLG